MLAFARAGKRDFNRLVKVANPPNMSILKTIGQTVAGLGLEKPEYKVLGKAEGYEERQYVPCKWVSTTVQDISCDSARSKGFQRLFKYITGDNEKEMKIDMTAPVATKIVPGAGPNCENTFTVSFYIPSKHQEDPPKPKSADVFIEDFPEMHLYSTSFGGFASEDDWIKNARELSEKVKDKNVNEDNYFIAGYDSPFKLFNRCNEVWMLKK